MRTDPAERAACRASDLPCVCDGTAAQSCDYIPRAGIADFEMFDATGELLWKRPAYVRDDGAVMVQVKPHEFVNIALARRLGLVETRA